jgi:hypothetical protein
VLQGSAYRAIGGENLSPWSKRVTARCQRLLRFEGDQILPSDKTAPEGASGLLLVGMTPDAAVETASTLGTTPSTFLHSPAFRVC